MRDVISIEAHKVKKRQTFRSRVAAMNKTELMGEFLALMTASAGKQWSLPEAEDCQYLMEVLLRAAENEIFKSQLRASLSVLKSEIAKLRN